MFLHEYHMYAHHMYAHLAAGVIFIKHLMEKLVLRGNFDTELQQNQITLRIIEINVGCRSNSVHVYVNRFQIIK